MGEDINGGTAWLIIATARFKPKPDSLPALITQLIPQLVERATQYCRTALTQLKGIKSLQERSQNLDSSNAELESTNQLKNQFLANTSHEIRSPLTSIIGFTHLLLAQGYDSTRENHQEYLNIIQSSGKHLLCLINDILDLSKIEANQLDVNWEIVDVRSACQNVLALVKEKAANKGLQLRLELEPDITTLVADPLRLKQMLLNLLFNAVKFTVTGSIRLQVFVKAEFMHFSVWDTGIGISLENQALLFQPYSQVANHVVGREEGTGLGLVVTRKLAELHGGSLELKSEVNHGSQFTIVLPVKPIKAIEELPDVEEVSDNYSSLNGNLITPKKSSPEILLVEDDPNHAKLVQIYLRKQGYRLTWVKTVASFWDVLKKLKPAVVLMDVYLSDGNGLELVKEIRANQQYDTMIIIAQTGMAMKGDREICLAAGVNDYISKPIDLALLGNLVAKYSKVN